MPTPRRNALGKMSPVSLFYVIMLSMRVLSIGVVCLLISVQLAVAQQLEPRRWTHLPVGVNFAAVGYAYTESDIFFDPALKIENATSEVHTGAFSYLRALDVFGKSGRIDVTIPYSTGRWAGLLEGQPASTRRRGFNDPRMRFAVNLLGSPAQRGAEFRQFEVNTIVGVAMEITVPLGEYQKENLINLGGNRWIFRPQIGVVHNWAKWAAEVTGSAWFYTDNDEFAGDKTREQDPLLALQSHLIYTFRPGLWASLSAAYGAARAQKSMASRLTIMSGKRSGRPVSGFPIDRRQGIKIAYMRGQTTERSGDDYDRIILAYSTMWGGQ